MTNRIFVEELEQECGARIFQLSLGAIRAQVSTLGASLTKILLPYIEREKSSDLYVYDNLLVVNDAFVSDTDDQSTYNRQGLIAVNNEMVTSLQQSQWNAQIIDVEETPNGKDDESNIVKGVEFTQSFGERGKTMNIRVTYHLQSTPVPSSAKLFYKVNIAMAQEATNIIPIQVTQQSNFNLSRQNDVDAILNHTLQMNCREYYPINDDTESPISVIEKGSCIDWSATDRFIGSALMDHSTKYRGLTQQQAENMIKNREVDEEGVLSEFDQKYAIHQKEDPPKENSVAMKLAAVLKYGSRRLTICTDAPCIHLGLCTAQPTSGVCLTAQPRRSVSLTAENPQYEQRVQYCFEYYDPNVANEYDPDLGTNSMPQFAGSDTLGQSYETAEEMWELQGVVSRNNNDGADSTDWYDRAADYYEENCPETVDGVLGGFAKISEPDIKGSREFIQDIQEIRPSFLQWWYHDKSQKGGGIACECGAGIGRVTKHLLMNLQGITESHLVESSSRLLFSAPEYIGDPMASRCKYYCDGLQDWEPRPNTYSIIWIQWVLIYLTDEDIVKFLKRCGKALTSDGIIVLKENNCEKEDFVLDVDDASVTRSERYWRHLIHESGMRIVYRKLQTGFPEELFQVPILALEPHHRKPVRGLL